MSTDCATAEARVVGWTTAGVRVALAANGGCGRCAARGGCGARWLLRRSDDRRELEIDTEQPRSDCLTSAPGRNRPTTQLCYHCGLIAAVLLLF